MSKPRSTGDWARLQELIKNEQELLGIMAELSEDDFRLLVSASKDYAGALKTKYDALKEENLKQRRLQEAAMQQKQQAHEEKLQRAAFQQKQEELAAENKRQMALEQQRTQEEKQRIEYRLKRELDATAEKTRMKLETQRQFSEMEAQRLADEERLARVRHQLEQDAREQEHRRESQLKLQLEKARAEQDRMTQLELQQRQLDLDMKRHAQMKDWLREKELETKRIQAEADVRMEELKWQAAQDFFAGQEGRRRLTNAALFVSLSVGGFFLARNVVTHFLIQAIRKRFFKP